MRRRLKTAAAETSTTNEAPAETSLTVVTLFTLVTVTKVQRSGNDGDDASPDGSTDWSTGRSLLRAVSLS